MTELSTDLKNREFGFVPTTLIHRVEKLEDDLEVLIRVSREFYSKYGDQMDKLSMMDEPLIPSYFKLGDTLRRLLLQKGIIK